jgi:hypothetical protein
MKATEEAGQTELQKRNPPSFELSGKLAAEINSLYNSRGGIAGRNLC